MICSETNPVPQRGALFLGGNRWAYVRDLLHTDKLVKAYHTNERIFRTFRMAEASGTSFIFLQIICRGGGDGIALRPVPGGIDR